MKIKQSYIIIGLIGIVLVLSGLVAGLWLRQPDQPETPEDVRSKSLAMEIASTELNYLGVEQKNEPDRSVDFRLVCRSTKNGQNTLDYFIFTSKHPDYAKAKEWMTSSPYKEGDKFRMLFSQRSNNSTSDNMFRHMNYLRLP